MEADTGDRKSVAALGVALGHEGFPHSLTSSTLPHQEQQLVLAMTEQQAKQDEQVKQQQAPSVAGGEEQEVHSEKPKKGLEPADAQQQSQELLTLACCSKEMGLERREGGSREQLFSLASFVAEEGDEKQQLKGAGPQQRYGGKAELCDEDEDEEEEQQQLPSTVDSVASSTDSNGLGGGRITAELHEALCGTSSAAAFSVLACAKKLRGLSRTSLLVAAAAPEMPTLQAFCDGPAVPALPLPLPAPLTEAPKAGAADITGAALRSEGDKDMDTLAAAAALITANEGGRRTAEDAARTLAGGEMQMKKNEGEQQTLVSNVTTTAAVAVVEMGCETAALKTTTATTAAAVLTGAEIETGAEGRQGEQGRGDRAAKIANERDVHGTWSAGKEEESAIMSFRMHSRRKQSAAEQGRIAAAAVAAATRLFSREETGKSSSSSSLAKEQQQKGVQLPQLQKRSTAVVLGEKAGGSSLAAGGHPTYPLFHPLQEQQQQQEQGQVQLPEEAEEIDRLHHGKERQEERRLLPCFETEEQQQQPRTVEQVLRQQQTKKLQERQQENKHSLFAQLLAAELREEEKNMLRTFCCAEEGEIAAAMESPALLLSQGGQLFSNKSGIEQDQQQLQRAERWRARSDNEAEDDKRLLVGQTYFDSSTSSLSSLLQQQADTPALLFSAAALQHEASTKNSSLAAFSPGKTSPVGNFASGPASAAAAVNTEITDALVAAASKSDRTMWGAREDIQALKREEIGDFAAFQKATGDRERSALLSASERDVMLSFMDLPRVLSLATQASSPDRAAFDQLQQAAAFSSHKAYNTPTSSAIAAQYAAAASGSEGDAATAARAASLHAFSPAAAASRKTSTTVPYQQPSLCPDNPTATDAPARTSGGVDIPAACLSGAQSGAGRVEPSPVPSLCLQAAMRPPPGLDTQAREYIAKDLEDVLRSDDPSTSSTAVATTASALLSASSGRRHSAAAAAALFASATQKSLAAAVAALAATAGTPMGSGAVVPRGTADGGLSPAAADLCRQEGLFSADDILRVAAAAAAGVGGNSCSNISDRADILNAESSSTHGTTPSCSFPQRKGSSGSNPLYDAASKHLLLAALAREPAAGTREADAGGAALAAAVAARQQGRAVREGEKLWLSQPSRVGGAGGEATTIVGRDGSGDGFSTEKVAPGLEGCSRLYVPSCQGGLRSTSAGESEGRTEPLFVRKQQVAMPLQKYGETQLQHHHEGGRLMQRCGRETGAAGSLRLFDAVAEGRTGRRAATEGRETTVEGGRAAGYASTFPSNGGRGYSGTGNIMARQAWLSKGEYLQLLELQQQRGGRSRNAAYCRGIADRNTRKAAAAREKPAPELQKDGFKVFFGNASALTTEEEMYGLFRQYGECSELILLRDRRQRLRGAGFVTFKNAADATRAIDGLDRKYTVLMVERLKDIAARASCRRPSTGTAEAGGTKPLEVRVPENSEQKRERIRALARLRAENAQQQSQVKQHQQGIQQHLQQEYHPYQQLQQGSAQQQYTQQQRSLLSQQKPQHYSNILHHASHFASSQGQQYSQQQQQYSKQQLHPYYEQHRGAPMQPAQQQQRAYSEQQQRGEEPLQAAHGYALSSVCERGIETTGELLWQSGDACLLEASRGSVMCSPIKGEKSEAATAASPQPATALQVFLASAAHQQQHTQQREQDQMSCLAGGATEGAQNLLAWLERYTRYGEGGSVMSALADKQQQMQKQEPQHAVQQKGNVSTGIPRTVVSHFHEPFGRSGTLHLGRTADQIVAACIGEQPPEEEGEYWKKTLNISPGISQDSPSVTLNQALTAAFSSPKTTNGVASDRISCSAATPTGGSAWQGPLSAMMDQKIIASSIPRTTSAARSSPAVASPSSSEDVDAFPAALSTAASDGTAPVTAAAGARVEPPGSGTSPAACEETDLSYVNAVANMLCGRTSLPSGCGERDSAAASLSSRAPPSRYAASPCSYSRLAPSDAAFLQSASTASPAALSPFLAPFAAVEKPGRLPDSELHDSKAPAAAAAAATPLSNLGRMRLSPPQQQDGGSRFHPDLYNGNGKLSEPGTNNPGLLRETD